MKAIPKLRFKEFEGEWQPATMNEYTVSSAFGPRFSSDLYTPDGNVVTLRTTDMNDNGDIDYTHAPLAELSLAEFEDHILKEGDLVISRSGTIGVTGLFETYDVPVIPGAFLIRFRLDKSKAFPIFIRQYLNSNNGRKKSESLSAGGVQKNLTSTSVLKMSTLFPSLPEQQKIASFLSLIDEKIQQLGRKRELLEQYKKGVMQQLFSCKLRFKDENGKPYPKWEEKRLGEIATIVKGKGISKTDIVEGGTLECIRYGELYTHYKERITKICSRTNLDKSELVLSDYNDVIIPSSGETQIDIARAACVLKSGVALGGDLNILVSRQNGVFLSYYINHSLKYEIAKIAQGNSVVHLYPTQLETLKTKLPCLDEQRKIADYIGSIDDKIESIDAQITHIQTFKKGLLQQMFV